MERLYDKLKAYSESDFYAFHMPGHKRNKALLGIELPYDLDITEIDGFDDLHHADGILKEEQERAKGIWGRGKSFSGKWKYCRNFKCSDGMYAPGR